MIEFYDNMTRFFPNWSNNIIFQIEDQPGMGWTTPNIAAASMYWQENLTFSTSYNQLNFFSRTTFNPRWRDLFENKIIK